MSSVGIVCMIVGVVVVVSRGLLLLAPGATLGWFRNTISTEARTRVLGLCVGLIAVPMVWAGASEESVLAGILLVFGVFIGLIGVPLLMLFPRAYMNLCDGLLPADLTTSLIGWRVLGLIGVIVGGVLFYFGWLAL